MTLLRHAAAAVLFCTACMPAIAAEPAAPLPAGRPAGSQQAALAGGGFAIMLGLAGVIAMTAIIVSQDNNKGVTTPTTTATGTGP